MIIGLVGKPSSGKSTFFKAATEIDVKISSIPFTTIEPNVGIGYVAVKRVDKEFGITAQPRYGFLKGDKRFMPVKLIDVAGLVPGAHKGRGLGNKFLDDLRQASVLLHIVDFSGKTDAEGKPVEAYDPEDDIKFLEDEINFWFEEKVKVALEKVKRRNLSKDELIEYLAQKLSGLQVGRRHIEEVLREVDIENLDKFSKRLREIAKPILIVANKIDIEEAKKNYQRLKDKYNLVPVSSEAEVILKKAWKSGLIDYMPGDNFEVTSKLTEEQERALQLIKEKVLIPFGSTGVQQALNKAVFDVLGYVAVYPVASASKLTDKNGRILPDVFLMPRGSTTRDLAYKVHTDIGDRFISGIDARTKRRLAADYELKHRDVVEIMYRK